MLTPPSFNTSLTAERASENPYHPQNLLHHWIVRNKCCHNHSVLSHLLTCWQLHLLWLVSHPFLHVCNPYPNVYHCCNVDTAVLPFPLVSHRVKHWCHLSVLFSPPPIPAGLAGVLQDSSGLCKIASQSFNIGSQSCEAWQSWAELGRAWQDLSRVWQDLAGFNLN